MDPGPRRHRRRLHAAQRALKFLDHLGAGLGSPRSLASRGRPFQSAKLAARPLSGGVRALLPAKETKWVALHPSSGAPSKRWPDAHWRRLLETLLSETDCVFFWVGDAEARSRARRIEDAAGLGPAGRLIDLCDALPLGELGSFLGTCDLLITPDSGPAHIAASWGVKTLVLFSGSNEVHGWKPLGDASWVVYHEVPCAPCHERTCRMERHFCMEGITPESVYEQVRKILATKVR